MRYPFMTAVDATAYLAGRWAETPRALEPLIKSRGDGPEMVHDFVSELRADMEAIKARYPDGLKNNAEENAFEAKAARSIHERLHVDAVILADADFWRWLAVAHFSDVVEWRYGRPEGGTGLANYGVGAKSENLLYRLWLRAELVLDDTERDRYHLCDRGQIDFYRSHLFRQGYANARAFARALLRYQYPEPLQATQPTLKVAEIRELVKRLRRMRTNLFVEILNEDECRQIIEEEAVRVLGPE